MTNELYFKKLPGIGNLYLEYVFLEFEFEPILFACSDDNNRCYLCLCSEIRGEQRWIVSECDLDTLRKLVYKKIDISHALCQNNSVIVVTLDIDGHETSKSVNIEELDKLDLPKSGTMLKCDIKDAIDYINGKNSQGLLVKTNSYYNAKLHYESYHTILIPETNRLVKETCKSFAGDIISINKEFYKISNHKNYIIEEKNELTCEDFLSAS